VPTIPRGNNVLALAFGNRNHNMLPMEQIMNMQR